MPPHVLKLLSALCFGVAAALLGVVAWRSLQGETLSGSGSADPSQRRAEMRRRAMGASSLFSMMLLWLRLPAMLLSRLNLVSLKQWVRGPYARAGYPGGLEDEEVVALGVVLSAAAALFVAFSTMIIFGAGYAWLGLSAAPLGFLGMVSSLKSRAEVRQIRILRAMPYVLDLIVLILRSGTSLTIALQRVVADYLDHPVGDELGQVLAEMEMGATRVEGFRRLAARVSHPDIVALADSIVQSEELGWPLAETLQRQADRMAAERVLAAQAKAGAAGVMVMLPSTLVLLAAVLLLFGPMLVRLFQGAYKLQ